MTYRAFFDANVLAYGFDKSAPEKREIAQELIREWLPSRKMVISTQVLQELFIVLTRGLKPSLPTEKARKVIEDFSKIEVHLVEPEIILRAIDVSQKHKISFWDALIVSAASKARCRVLFTEDLNHGQKIEGVKIVNPFQIRETAAI